MVSRTRRLLLLRHGQTDWNASDRMQGQLDTDLSELGRTQAKDVAREISAKAPVAVISSDLRRAYDTAVAVGEAAQLPVQVDERLRETNLGEWQGLNHVEVDEQYPGARVAWRRDATMSPPGGESRVDVAHRAVPLVQELLATQADWDRGPVVLVAHGGLVAALTAALLDLPVDRWPVLGGLGNASWVQLSAHNGGESPDWRLDVWNASTRVVGDVI
ncbi:histidine phosphatase family protein [Skermania sp. ID1734]|uniref:histidine phosphatase family protein n=1 Tax=Skermania sp. ID1734 TaxID=2597516 RepID=UPI00117F08D5|nr:histidine phosphatase family protein [Skermania sp. ID1734]TSE00029.1 histidine phosphatase family protein [Skermania sp. ID1734]